jgi:mono/diheme cytochrome c family protein
MTRNILLATLFTLGSAIALLGIFLTEKSVRIPQATAATIGVQMERGAMDYDQYCATCHGLAGQGAANETGAPALNNIVQRYNTPTAAGVVPFDAPNGIRQKYGTMRNYIEATLIAGVRGTPMPAWAQSTGGPLRMDQIENITTYILAWNGQAPESAVAVAETAAAEAMPTPDPLATPFRAGEALFTSKACVGCHAIDDSVIVGPGLGGLFQPGGTAAYGEILPNGQPVTEESVLEWIRLGTAGFPEHVPPQDGNNYPAMPPIAITDEEYANLLVYLQALNRDGSIVEGADAPTTEGAEPGTDAGTEQPTPIPTAPPGQVQEPMAPAEDATREADPAP